MAEKSGFFNALINEGTPDRKYNANDYSDNLAVVISNGVLRSTNDDLKVTASGLVASVGVGRGWIKGHWYNNDSTFTFTATTAPISGSRYDRVMLRFDNSLSNRKISLVYVQGTAAATPAKPAPTRSGNIYDLVLADLLIAANGTSMTVTDTRADSTLCGWVFSTSGDASFFTSLDNSFNAWFSGVRNTLSSVTLFKRYQWNTTLSSTASSVAFNIPQYDADTCFLTVLVNGIHTSSYTLSNNVVTFSGTLTAGTRVDVLAYKSIDGTGIQSVSDEITQLQNQYATLAGVSKWTYKCTGLNDNIALSQIAQAIYNKSYTVGTLSNAAEAFLTGIGGNAFLTTLPDDFQLKIDVVGTLGATTPHAGTGTAESRYRWFSLGISTTSDKKIVFDFSKCEKINIACTGNNIIFFGNDFGLIGANVYAGSSTASTVVTMIASSNELGRISCDRCRFKIVTTGKAVIASGGTFNDCILHVKSSSDVAYCIDAKSASLARCVNGTYFAYCGSASNKSALFNIDSAATNGVIMCNNINAPTIAQTGYTQSYVSQANAGKVYIAGICTTLIHGGSSTYRSITGTISINKQ